MGVSPAVMLNRLAYQQAPAKDAQLARVALLTAQVRLAQDAALAKAQASQPDNAPKATRDPITNGADIDRLV